MLSTMLSTLLSTLLSTRESILEGDALRPTVPIDAGACHIGSGVRTMKKCVAPLPRPPLPASAAEPQARVAMINNAMFSLMAFDLDALPVN